MTPYGATVLRVVLGVIFLTHAYLALVVYTPAGIAAFNAKYGIPLPAVAGWVIILTHGGGGIMLILGLLTRWAAAANALVMLGALVFVHLDQGFFLHGTLANGNLQAAGYEYVLTLVGAAIAQVLLGGGALAFTRDR
jgi:putative oxidoreductase